MKSKLFILTAAFCVISAPALAGRGADPCIGQDAAQNTWFVGMNDGGVSTREGLLKTLTLLGTGGFTPSYVFAYDDSITQTKSILVKFDPTYWADPARAEQVKTQVLRALVAIPGNSLGCDYNAYPAPAMGVRN